MQILGALAFIAVGITHSVLYERSRQRILWMQALPRWALLTIGTLEILGGIGLVLPAATGVLSWLTPLAAACLVALMVFAIVFHVFRREWPNIAVNAVLGALALFVAYGRLVVVPF